VNIEGRNTVLELLKSKRDIKKLYLERNINKKNEKIDEIIGRTKSRRIRIEKINKKKLNQLSETGNHQGVIAIASIRTRNLTEILEVNFKHKVPNNFIYIRDVTYEHNIGAIARSAEAAGLNGIILPPKIGLTPESFRASMGALAHLRIINESLFNAIKIAQENAIRVVGIETDTKKYYYQSDLKHDTMFIIGGEDHPLSQQVLKRCDSIVKIPMHGKINSLNMSVAASIVIFDKLRQTNHG
jgi:23S rRNA (guanosine2251-2'-O)-methyltransferase